MKKGKTVTVIGGGIAGLAAAVFLTKEGFRVTLYEASPKMGGRAYSFFDREKKMFFDNGQHILAGWYEQTFEYLKLIGSYGKLNFQKGLEVSFVNTQKEVYTLKCPDKSAPMNLLEGLLKYKALGLKDKLAIRNIYSLINEKNDFKDKYPNVSELLKGIKQSDRLIKYFWQPFILAVFNASPENVGVDVFLNVMREGFNQESNSVLVIPEVNLNELLINDALRYLEQNDARVVKDCSVENLIIDGGKVGSAVLDGGKIIQSDFYVSAVSFFAFKRLFEPMDYERNNFKSELLKASGIVSVHLFFKNNIPDNMLKYGSFGMTGLIGTIVQWIFRRSDKHLSLVISGADHLQITDMEHEKIFRICLDDLCKTIGGITEDMIEDYRIIKEKRATFIPDHLSNEFRQPNKTNYRNFFVAGDWTDTGFPATIESAVRSAKQCSELIIDSK